MVENIYLLEVPTFFTQLKPSEPVMTIIDPKTSNFWRKLPFPHEVWLMGAYAYLVEQADSIAQDDALAVAGLFTHLASLENKQVTAELPKNRSRPLLLDEQHKYIMQKTAQEIESREFFQYDNWQKELLTVFRKFFITLKDAKVFIPANSPNIFEDQIRHLSQDKHTHKATRSDSQTSANSSWHQS